MTVAKVKILRIAITNLVIAGSVLFSIQAIFSLPEEYEGKIIRKVEFIGLNRLDDGSYERIPLRNVDERDLRAYCLTEEGYPLDLEVIADDIDALFSRAAFMNVEVEVTGYRDGVHVRFFCEERPMVDRILFRGISEIAEAELSDVIAVKPGDAFRTDMVEQSVHLLKERYIEEGLFNVVVTYDIEETSRRSRDNLVNVVFKVDEGEEINIEKINFLGASKVNDTRLRKFINHREDSIFSDGSFSRANFELDQQMILVYYRQEGYLDADIVDASFSYEWVDPEKREERGIFITYRIHEGERYYFDKYTIEGNIVISTDHFLERMELRHREITPLSRAVKRVADFFGTFLDDDTICNDTFFQMDRYMMAYEYGKKGYLFTRITPERNVTERRVERGGQIEVRKYVHYHLVVNEGNKAYLENILIRGNDKTQDNVIRRELLFKEGELYNAEKVELSKQRLHRLGYFEEVNIDIRPGSSDDKANIIISVIEQNTGMLSLGGGYGSDTGFTIFTEVGEKNLMGRGYQVNTRFEYGPYRSAFSVSYVDRWFLDYPLAFSARIFYSLDTIRTASVFPESDDYAYYKRQNFGYSLGLAYRFWTFYSLGTRWTHTFKTVKEPTGSASEEVMRLNELGILQKRQLTFYGAYDTKDSDLNPTEGVYAYLGYSIVGGMILWGDDHYTELNPRAEWFRTLFEIPYLRDYPVVFQLRGSANFIMPPLGDSIVERRQPHDVNPWLEMSDRLLLGGAHTGTLRGWDYYDSRLPDSWRERLYHRVLYGAEVRVPIHRQLFWMAFFFDAGALYSDQYWDQHSDNYEVIERDKRDGLLVDISEIHTVNPLSYFKYSYGVGFRLQIPMMPLRFWIGRRAEWSGLTDGGFESIGRYNFQMQIGDVQF